MPPLSLCVGALEPRNETQDIYRRIGSAASSGICFAQPLPDMDHKECLAKGGRYGDYDDGCKDSEISLGRVRDMMCPCTCCAPTESNSALKTKGKSSVEILRLIPEADKNRLALIHRTEDWRNPLLLVGLHGVKIHTRSGVTFKKLRSKLSKLPRAAWPYGRAVAIGTDLNDSYSEEKRTQDKEGIKANIADVTRNMKELGFEVVVLP